MRGLLFFLAFFSFAFVSGSSTLSVEEQIDRLRQHLSSSRPMFDTERSEYLQLAVKSGNQEYIDMILPKIYDQGPIPISYWGDDDIFTSGPLVVTIQVDFASEKCRSGALYALKHLTENGAHSRIHVWHLDEASLKRDADLLQEIMKLGLEAINKLLIESALCGHFELLWYLVAHGADINYSKESSLGPTSVLKIALESPDKCDLKCLKSLIHAGAKPNFSSIDSRLIEALFKATTTDTIKFLMSEKVEIPGLWEHILASGRDELFVDAIDNGYELKLSARFKIVSELLKNAKFNLVPLFIKNTSEETQRDISYFAIEQIDSIDRGTIRDAEKRHQLSQLSEFLDSILMNLSNPFF